MTDNTPPLSGADYRMLTRLAGADAPHAAAPAYARRLHLARLVAAGLAEVGGYGSLYRRTPLAEQRLAATTSAMREGRAPR